MTVRIPSLRASFGILIAKAEAYLEQNEDMIDPDELEVARMAIRRVNDYRFSRVQLHPTGEHGNRRRTRHRKYPHDLAYNEEQDKFDHDATDGAINRGINED